MRSSSFSVGAVLASLVVVAVSSGCDRKPAPAPQIQPPIASGAVSAGAHASAPAPADSTPAPHAQAAKVEFPEVHIRPDVETRVRVAWRSPPGTGVNEEAPFKVRWSHSDALANAPADVKATGTSAREGFDIRVTPLGGTPNATLSGVIDLVVCDMATHAVCVPVRRTIEIEFVVNKAAPAEATVTVDLPQAKT